MSGTYVDFIRIMFELYMHCIACGWYEDLVLFINLWHRLAYVLAKLWIAFVYSIITIVCKTWISERK